MLTINPGGFPKAEKEIAVPTLVMELKEALEALKPKPKEQALEDEMGCGCYVDVDGCIRIE